MGRRKFQQLKLALFIHTYCGNYLIKKIVTDFQNNPAQAKFEISLLTGATNLKSNLLCEAIFRNKRFHHFLNPNKFIFPKDKLEIPIFLAIEKEIIDISEKGLIEDLLEIDDYRGATLDSAVERAAGNKLAAINDDNDFNIKLSELKKSYLRCYYHVAYRYKLPTIRILPFILRLISP